MTIRTLPSVQGDGAGDFPDRIMSKATGNIAIITRSPLAGGQTFVRRHIKYLNGGHTVVICNKQYEEDVLGKPTARYKRLTAEEYVRSVIGSLPRPLAVSGSMIPGRKKQLKAFLDHHDVSHILLEFGYVATDFGPEITELGRPVYCMFRGNDGSSRLRSSAYRRLLKQVLPKLDGVISVSSHLLGNLEQAGIFPRKSVTVPSGVNTELFVPGKTESGLCLSVGRLVPKKSPMVLIRAFAKYCEMHDLRLEFIGDGSQQVEAEALVASLGIADRVTFLGHLAHDEVVKRMGKAMIYLQHFQTPPSGDTEGMPNVIQEAMACGLPIVTTRHAGIPDHIEDGVTGMLVEPGDVDGFGKALDALCASPKVRKEIGSAARQYAVEELDYRISHRRIEEFMGVKAANLSQ